MNTETNSSVNEATIDSLPEGQLSPAERKLSFKSLLEQSEGSLAQEFAQIYGDRYRYDHSRQRWLIWDGHRWRPDADKEIHRAAEHLAKRRYEKAWHFGGDERDRVKAAKFALKASSAYLLDVTVKRAQHQKPIAAKGTEFDRNPMLLGCANGVVNLATGQCREGRFHFRRIPPKYPDLPSFDTPLALDWHCGTLASAL